MRQRQQKQNTKTQHRKLNKNEQHVPSTKKTKVNQSDGQG